MAQSPEDMLSAVRRLLRIAYDQNR